MFRGRTDITGPVHPKLKLAGLHKLLLQWVGV
jgi:hypothetical protein